MWSKLSEIFFKGLVVLLPLLITIWLLWFLFSFMDSILGNIITMAFGRPVPGLGLLITITLILFTGILAKYVIGEKIIQFTESLLFRVPLVKSIYFSAKQVNDVLFQSGQPKDYRKACIVQYPSPGIYSIGFITTTAAAEVHEKTAKDKMVCVFVPNTPTPATGFMIMVPANEVMMLDMKTEDAFKLVVSAGVLKPKERA